MCVLKEYTNTYTRKSTSLIPEDVNIKQRKRNNILYPRFLIMSIRLVVRLYYIYVYLFFIYINKSNNRNKK